MARTASFAGAVVLTLVSGGCATNAPGAHGAHRPPATTATTPPVRDGAAPSSDRDGPDPHPPTGLENIPDAEPQLEPVRPGGPNKPYEALGTTYVPIVEDAPYSERGLASWYGRKFQGRRTSSGEPYDMYAMTAAHPTLPIPSYARVRNPANGREVVVRINDRGPFHSGRVIDLSYTAALKLGVLRGVTPVEVQHITGDDIRTGAWRSKPAPGTVDAPATLLASAAGSVGGTHAVDGANSAAAAGLRPTASTVAQTPAGAAPNALPMPGSAAVVSPAPSGSPGADGLATTETVSAGGSVAMASFTIAAASVSATGSTATGPRPPVSEAADATEPSATNESTAPSPTAILRPAQPAASSATPLPTPTQPSGPPATPSAATATATAAGAGHGYWLQLGAFRQREGADSFSQKVAADADWLAPMLAVFDDRSLFRLQAGPYASREAARGAAERLRALLQLVPVVVARP